MPDESENSSRLLVQLADSCSLHARLSTDNRELYLQEVLEAVTEALEFDAGILYRVANVIDDNFLVLEITHIAYGFEHTASIETEGEHWDIRVGRRIGVDLNSPALTYLNESSAFSTKAVASAPLPGWGADICGYIEVTRGLGYGYLLSCDYIAKERVLTDSEQAAFKISCNLLSATLMREHYEKQSLYDSLTGIINRAGIDQAISSLFKRHEREPDAQTAIIMADIDWFKRINDTRGHLQGDLVLQEFSKLFVGQLREGLDVVGRYGGEEFVAILHHVDDQEASETAERLRELVEAYGFASLDASGVPCHANTFQVTASFGVACFRGKIPGSIEAVLEHADKALYRSKEEGRNRVTLG